MAAIATYSDLVSLDASGVIVFPIKFVSVTATRLVSIFTNNYPAGVAPTTAVVPNGATAGGITEGSTIQTTTKQLWQTTSSLKSTDSCITYLVDRLSHQGGLSGASASEQTTNLPTAALTRYTSGDGVWAGLQVYTAIGSTASTVSGSYTNQAGTAGRTFTATQIGGSGFNAQHRLIVLVPQDGDTGVRSVESITLSGTTGTAGNIGVVLFKILKCLRTFSDSHPYGDTCGPLFGAPFGEEFQSNACVDMFCSFSSANQIGGAIRFAQS